MIRDVLSSAHLAEPPRRWSSEESDRLVCRAIVEETHDVKTFVFQSPEPRAFHFMPGQFLTWELPIDGEIVHRCYTAASSPTRPYSLSITVKRVAGGPASNWLHDRLKVGDSLTAVGPLGDFTFLKHPAPKYLFLSGGSGITPLMSMTRALHDLAADLDVIFVHFARSPRDIIFRRELDLIARRQPKLRVVHVVEQVDGEPSWTGFTGRASRPLIELIAPDLAGREVFCCGPSAFMAAVRGILAEAGHDRARYHEESFNFEELAPATIAEVAAAEANVEAMNGVATYRITFAKIGKVIECRADTNILDAAIAAGIRLPSSCTQGLCGTCKSKKLSGDVEMHHRGGIRQREIDQGMVLLCCGKPQSDVTIDR